MYVADENRKNEEVKKAAPRKPNAAVRASGRIRRYFREMRSELKKVVWPTPKQVLNNSIIVAVSVVLVSVVTFLFDTGVGQIVKSLINVFQG